MMSKRSYCIWAIFIIVGSLLSISTQAIHLDLNQEHQPNPITTDPPITISPYTTTTATVIVPDNPHKPNKKKPFDEIMDHFHHQIDIAPDLILDTLQKIKDSIKKLINSFPKTMGNESN